MTAFDQAWALLKDSASKEDYNQLELGEMITPQDIDLNPVSAEEYFGNALLSRRTPRSKSRLHPSAIMARDFKNWKEGDELSAVDEMKMMNRLYRTGAHEGTHQGIHFIEPSLRHNPVGHEYGAFTGEFAQDPIHNPRNLMRHIRAHPELDEDQTEGIQEIIDHLFQTGSPAGQKHIMSQRARENAQDLMEEEEEEEKWYNAVHGGNE